MGREFEDPRRKVVSASEFGKMFGMSKDKVSNLLRAKHVKGMKIGRVWMIPKSEVTRIMEELEGLPCSPVKEMPYFQ